MEDRKKCVHFEKEVFHIKMTKYDELITTHFILREDTSVHIMTAAYSF